MSEWWKSIGSANGDNKKTKTKKERKQRTTSKDVPGSGMAKKAAKAIEKRKKMLKNL